MLELVARNELPAMSPEAIDKARRMHVLTKAMPQVTLETRHVLHGGLYSRTIKVPRGVMITGAMIKIATLVIVEGDASVWMGDTSRRLTGYNVLPASAGRKQVFVAHAETHITMIFPTGVRTVAEAEAEFTDEASALSSRDEDANNHYIVTGE